MKGEKYIKVFLKLLFSISLLAVDGVSSGCKKKTNISVKGVCDFDLNESSLTRAGFTKIYEENFSTDLSKWDIWTGGAHNNELQHYQPQNLKIANGKLVITAKEETVTGITNELNSTLKTFYYSSGRIESKANFSASSATPKVRISARIKLPTGYGMWPAFWSYTEPWPVHGEIDIMEARGQKPFEYQTNYFYGTEAYKNILVNKVAYMRSNVSLTDCYHVYEVIWAKNTLSFLFDGKVIETKAGEYVPKIFGKTHRLILNLSVGGNMFSGSFFKFDASKIKTGVMYVDWVKVFTSK